MARSWRGGASLMCLVWFDKSRANKKSLSSAMEDGSNFVWTIQSSQDKIKMQHYVPLHPQVIGAVEPLIDDRNDDETVFLYNSLAPWVKRQQIPLSRTKGNFVLGDLRKFAEQYGDIIQWDQSNRAS